MGNLNKVFLIGRLTWLPEMRLDPWNTPMVNVSFATVSRFNGKEKEERHRLFFRGRMAEIVAQYCKKDSKLFIEGSLRTRSWMDPKFGKRFTTEVHVRRFQMLDKKEVKQKLVIRYNNHVNDFQFEYPNNN